MWNFVFGCFMLGASTVGLLHGQMESLIGVFVVVLWFTGLFRPGRTLWLSFLQIGALAGSLVYAYDAFVSDLSSSALLLAGIVAATLTIAAAVMWGRAIVAARREGLPPPRPRRPVRRRRERSDLWVEVAAWVVLVGLPFGAGAWAAEAAFEDREQEDAEP